MQGPCARRNPVHVAIANMDTTPLQGHIQAMSMLGKPIRASKHLEHLCATIIDTRSIELLLGGMLTAVHVHHVECQGEHAGLGQWHGQVHERVKLGTVGSAAGAVQEQLGVLSATLHVQKESSLLKAREGRSNLVLSVLQKRALLCGRKSMALLKPLRARMQDLSQGSEAVLKVFSCKRHRNRMDLHALVKTLQNS
eukprot:scaffold102088_cov22-Tisochrysis_lutea.AAC.1